MKHVKKLSRENVPAKAIFVVEINDKSGCKSVPPNEEDACKETVKGGGTYSHVIL